MVCSLSSEQQGREDSAIFSLGVIFFFSSVVLLDACILGISDLIDPVMGRSEWHAGMERSAHTHADTRI